MAEEKVFEDEREGRRERLHDQQGEAGADAVQRVETGDVADAQADGSAHEQPLPPGEEQSAAGAQDEPADAEEGHGDTAEISQIGSMVV